MNHQLAEQTQAVDKYLLNELTEAERLEFEEHYFDCQTCADQLKYNAIVVDNLKQVLLEEQRETSEQRVSAAAKPAAGWLSWLRPATFIPAFATLVLALVVGYQNFIYIPGLTRPQALETVPIPSAARDSGPVVAVDRRLPMFNLSFDVDSQQAYPSYTCDFQGEGKGSILEVDSGPRKVASFTLDLLLPSKQFPPGRYVMILRPASQPEKVISRFSFAIQDKEPHG
ncbi:MAG: zf-HC2 domain-containing protein [Bryobacteraceae bacterium]